MSMMGEHARYYEAPPGLEEKIRRSVQRESAAGWHWRWLALAAALLLVASVAGNVALLRSRVDQRELLAGEVLSAHLRSLAGSHLLDVPSSDQHTVKPWFNGKLDFSPEVRDLEGFPLLGGRMEYFEGHAAAALVYGRRKHIINLFTWPQAKPASARDDTRNGYHLESWSANGMAFWAVSDLNEDELRQFVAELRHARD
jgi:anti-sigma factor RsiW